MQSKRVFKICEGILCFLFYVKEFDVTVNKKYFPCINLLKFWPCCTQNHLVAEVGTRHSQQILSNQLCRLCISLWYKLWCRLGISEYHPINIQHKTQDIWPALSWQIFKMRLCHKTPYITHHILEDYCQISNKRHTKSPNLNVSRLVLQLSLPNPLKPGVKSRVKI